MEQPSQAMAPPELVAAPKSTPLRQFLSELVEQDRGEALLGTVRLYVRKAGLASGPAVYEMALEVFNEMVVEALAHEARFDTMRAPKAWLLGIAANIVKQKQDAVIKHNRRESLAREVVPSAQALSDAALFDRIAATVEPSPEQHAIVQEQVQTMLALVSPDDQQVIRLAILHGLNGAELARALNIKPAAARVRLHRALGRLRDAWEQQNRREQRDA